MASQPKQFYAAAPMQFVPNASTAASAAAAYAAVAQSSNDYGDYEQEQMSSLPPPLPPPLLETFPSPMPPQGNGQEAPGVAVMTAEQLMLFQQQAAETVAAAAAAAYAHTHLDQQNPPPLVDDEAASLIKTAEEAAVATIAAAAAAETTKRERRRFTEEERDAVRSGVTQYGPGKWKLIKETFSSTLSTRTTVQIKDCYRTMVKRGDIPRELGLDVLRKAAKDKAKKTGKKFDPAANPVVRRGKRKFTQEEKDAIVAGVASKGFGNWEDIRQERIDVLESRTSLQIKDCYRTMVKLGQAVKFEEDEETKKKRKQEYAKRAREGKKRKKQAREAAQAEADAKDPEGQLDDSIPPLPDEALSSLPADPTFAFGLTETV